MQPILPSRAVVKARVLGVDAKGRGLKLSLASTKKLADGEKAGAGGAGEASPIPAAGTFVYGKVRKLITGEVGFFWGRVVWSLGIRDVAGTVSRSRTLVHQYVLPLPQMDGQPAALAHAKSPHPSILPPHPSQSAQEGAEAPLKTLAIELRAEADVDSSVLRGIYGRLEIAHLADHPCAAAALVENLRVGLDLGRLLVLRAPEVRLALAAGGHVPLRRLRESVGH